MKFHEVQREEYLNFKGKKGKVLILYYVVSEVTRLTEFVDWLKEKDNNLKDFSVELTYHYISGNSHDEFSETRYDVWKVNDSFAEIISRKKVSADNIDELRVCKRAYCLFQGKPLSITPKDKCLIIKVSQEDDINISEMEEQLGLNEPVDWEKVLKPYFRMVPDTRITPEQWIEFAKETPTDEMFLDYW